LQTAPNLRRNITGIFVNQTPIYLRNNLNLPHRGIVARIEKNKPIFIKAPQGLRQRAVNTTHGLELHLTPEVRAKIEQTIEASKDEFSKDVLHRLQEIRREVQRAEDDEFQRIFVMSTIGESAFDIKGMGGTFGFPLLTHLAKSLHDFVSKIGLPNTEQFQVIRIHVDALYLVLAQGKSGAGGKIEKEMLETLAQAVKKVQHL